MRMTNGLGVALLLTTCVLGAVIPDLPTLRGQVPDGVTPAQLMCFLAQRNGHYKEYLEAKRDGRTDTERYRTLHKQYGAYADLARQYQDLGKRYNIRWDYAFFQMLLETKNLEYPGEVQRDQFNFAGVGADGLWERTSDRLRLRLKPKGREWWAFAASGRWKDRVLYKFIPLGGDSFQVIRRTEDGWTTEKSIRLIGRGTLRPYLREEGQEWYSGDKFDDLRQGVEGHLQHLSLYAGTLRPGTDLVADKSRSSASLIKRIREAWGRPIKWSDLGKKVTGVTVRGGGNPSIWAWENPNDPNKVGSYARGLDSINKTFLASYGPDPAVLAALKRFDEINAQYMANLKRQIEQKRALKVNFDKMRAGETQQHQAWLQALRDEMAKSLAWHQKKLAELAKQADDAPNDDALERIETEREKLAQQIAERTFLVHFGDRREYKDWELTARLREEAFADRMASFDRGEVAVYSPFGAYTWQSVLAQIEAFQAQLAEAEAGLKAHPLHPSSPAPTRPQLLEQLRSGRMGPACRQLLGNEDPDNGP